MKIINLLPKQKQDELHYEDIFHSVLMAVVIAVLILFAVLGVQIGVKIYLNYSASFLTQNTESIRKCTDKSENTQLKDKIKLNNAQMIDYMAIANTTPNWSRVLLAFAANMPSGMSITSWTADLETKKIIVMGQSETRESVIQLYSNINADTKNFKDIDYPLENVAKPTDVTFHFSFTVLDEALK